MYKLIVETYWPYGDGHCEITKETFVVTSKKKCQEIVSFNINRLKDYWRCSRAEASDHIDFTMENLRGVYRVE
jgi:hypothetical protein